MDYSLQEIGNFIDLKCTKCKTQLRIKTYCPNCEAKSDNSGQLVRLNFADVIAVNELTALKLAIKELSNKDECNFISYDKLFGLVEMLEQRIVSKISA